MLYSPSDEVSAILRNTNVEVYPGEFALVSIEKARWTELLDNQAAGPSGEAPFMIFSDPFEVTLLLNISAVGPIANTITDAKVERGFRLFTFSTAMDFTVVGFLAAVTHILAEVHIPVVALSSFSRDHLLIKQEQLAEALKALGPHVNGLC